MNNQKNSYSQSSQMNSTQTKISLKNVDRVDIELDLAKKHHCARCMKEG